MAFFLFRKSKMYLRYCFKQGFYILIICIISPIFAQSDAKIVKYKTSVIFGLGASKYIGDLCTTCSNVGIQANLSSRVRIKKQFYFRPEFAYQRVQSNSDPVSGLSFKNNTLGIHLNLEYAFTKDKTKNNGRAKNEFFLLLAPLVMHQNPFTTINGNKTFLAPLSTENKSYSNFLLGLKTGFYVDFNIAQDKRIGFSADYSLLFSDYIDDVSNKYIDYKKTSLTRALAIDPTQKSIIGSARGNKVGFDDLLRCTIHYEFVSSRKSNL